MSQDTDRRRFWAYALIAAVGLLAGMALGQLCSSREAGGSRIDWSYPKPAQPRSPQS